MLLVGSTNKNGLKIQPEYINKQILRNDAEQFIKIWTERCRWWAGQNKTWEVDSHDFHDGTPYDFNSILHYSPYTCAIDKNSPVITKPDGEHIEWKERTGSLSFWDIEQINFVYDCKPKGKLRIFEALKSEST